MKKSTIIAACAAMALTGLATSAAAQDAIAAAVADPDRPAGDVARDEARKPAEIVAFAGVKAGDTVIEFAPGRGYYTRILSRVVGPQGKVFIVVPPPRNGGTRMVDDATALADSLPNVSLVVGELDSFDTGEQADLAWTTENFHDFHNGWVDPRDFVARTYDSLKPGGIFFIEDHEAAAGAGDTVVGTLHRIDPEFVIEELQVAGFRFDAASQVLDNPADGHDLGVRDFDGVTDKFAFRFRKPE